MDEDGMAGGFEDMALPSTSVCSADDDDGCRPQAELVRWIEGDCHDGEGDANEGKRKEGERLWAANWLL